MKLSCCQKRDIRNTGAGRNDLEEEEKRVQMMELQNRKRKAAADDLRVRQYQRQVLARIARDSGRAMEHAVESSPETVVIGETFSKPQKISQSSESTKQGVTRELPVSCPATNVKDKQPLGDQLFNSNDIVHLDVGGTHYETTRDTLRGCRFFRTMFDGHGTSKEELHSAKEKAQYYKEGLSGSPSKIFVDRNGELFQYILNFLRERLRPSASFFRDPDTVARLITECEYFGYEDFLHELHGETNPHLLRPKDRAMREDEMKCLDFFDVMTATPEVAENMKRLEMAPADAPYSNDWSTLMDWKAETRQLCEWEEKLLQTIFDDSGGKQAPEKSAPKMSRCDARQSVPDNPLMGFAAEDPESLMLPLLFKRKPASGGSSDTSSGRASDSSRSVLNVKSFEEFRSAFNDLLDGLLDDLKEEQLSGLVFAGGAVLAALTGSKSCSDVDIFVVGLSSKEAERRFNAVLRAIKQNMKKGLRNPEPNKWLLVTRNRLCVTIHRGMRDVGMTANEMKKKLLPVQLVLSPCRSPLEVIINFDIDSCCVVFDPVKRVVQCLPRFRRALQTGVNVTDMAMRSPSYETRLEKYAQRGFAIGI